MSHTVDIKTTTTPRGDRYAWACRDCRETSGRGAGYIRIDTATSYGESHSISRNDNWDDAPIVILDQAATDAAHVAVDGVNYPATH